MKILQVSDTPRNGWAIGKICDAIIRNNPQVDMRFIAVHPKEVARSIDEFREAIKGVDLIHFHYWNSTQQLFNYFPELKNYKTIHSHHNQKNTLECDWRAFNIDEHTTFTSTNAKKLTDAGYTNVSVIPYGIDLNYFQYNENYGDQEYIGYVGRIVPWKGLKEIAWAARENGMRVLVMGRMDKPAYWSEIPLEDQAVIDFLYNNVPDEERINAYYDMQMYVGFSGDGREEGTQPLLEAMACGVPIITTPSGIAADIIQDNENGLIVPFENKEALKAKIRVLKEDKELRERLRKNAWNTIKSYPEARMARQFYGLYTKMLYGKESVSVISPVYNCAEIDEIYKSLLDQTYPIAEWIICDDNSDNAQELEAKATKWRQEAPFAIKYINTHKEGYNLAMARNLGVIEAIGSWLLFLDSRLAPEYNAVAGLMAEAARGKWLFGEKGGGKKAFVENFSLANRGDIIKFGMFNERIDRYGGMSQELRERWLAQGKETLYVPEAKARVLRSSKLNNKRRADIIYSKFNLYKMGL